MGQAVAYNAALEAWRQAIGQKNVTIEQEHLQKKETATFETTQKILAILEPETAEQVQECVRIACQFSAPLYPISTGKNWGYGSSVPAETDCVILSLAKLNRITDYNPELGVVRIETGVSQKQLVEFLEAQGGRHWVDTTSSSVDASVLANALERGHGMTMYADHVHTIADLTIVLPTGDVMRTGYGRFPNAAAASIDPWPPGPAVDGLFSQSNFGIVTEAALWLMPKPECSAAGFIDIADHATLAKTLKVFREHRLARTIASGPHICNEIRLIQTYTPYPWGQVDEKAALTPEWLTKLRASIGASPWNASFGLYGLRETVAAQRSRLDADFAKLGLIITWLDDTVATPGASADAAPMERFRQRVFSAMQGRLPGSVLRPFWRKRPRPGATDLRDVDQSKCGFIWCPFVVPFEGEIALKTIATIEQTMRAHGFDPDINFMSLRDRALHFYCSFVFDREVEGDDQKALACHQALLDATSALGIYGHRLGIDSMETMFKSQPTALNLMQSLKKAFDPHNIIAPKRYVKEKARRPRKNVLLIEDEQELRFILRAQLRGAGWTIEAVANGRAGLEQLKTTDFDAVLSDINMPELNGLDFLNEVRQIGNNVPVVFLSASNDATHIKEALRLGAFDYCDKPVEPEILTRLMARAISAGQAEFRSRQSAESAELQATGTDATRPESLNEPTAIALLRAKNNQKR